MSRLPSASARGDFGRGLTLARGGLRVSELGLSGDVEDALDVVAASAGDEHTAAVAAARDAWRRSLVAE